MALYPLKLLRTGMAGKAIGIGITATVLNGLFPSARHIEQPVPKAIALGCKRAVCPIRCVTRVALVVGNPLVLVVPGR